MGGLSRSDDLPDIFETAVSVVGKELNVLEDPSARVNKKPKYRLSKKAKMLIAQRRKAYSHWIEQEAPETGGLLDRGTWASDVGLRLRKDSAQKSPG